MAWGVKRWTSSRTFEISSTKSAASVKRARRPRQARPPASSPPIGIVVEIAGSGSQIRWMAPLWPSFKPFRSVRRHVGPGRQPGEDGRRQQLADRQRPHHASGDRRRSRRRTSTSSAKAAGDSTGRMSNFRRGVTRYPIPGDKVLPVTTDDLRSVFAADDSPHIEIGTVYPTDDIRGALYVDPMLSKHFAVLGSTGTGKSTSVSLILHRISELQPRGSHRDDRPARRIFGRVQGLRRAVQRRQSAAALLADELRRALRGAADHARRGAPARRRHPRQVPARRPHQGQEPRASSARSRSTRRSRTC